VWIDSQVRTAIHYLRWDDKYYRELACRSIGAFAFEATHLFGGRFNASETSSLSVDIGVLLVYHGGAEGTDTGPIAHGCSATRGTAAAQPFSEV
jgi:hypothetical protein